MTHRRFLLLCLGLFAVALLCLSPGCGYAKHIDPPLYTYDTDAIAKESARLHAVDVGGIYEQNECCGSMEPLIHAGDWVVTAPAPFEDRLLGRVNRYFAKWNGGKPVMHRFVSGNAKDGFIASGDNNAHSEPNERVVATTYGGEVVGIYRVKP